MRLPLGSPFFGERLSRYQGSTKVKKYYNIDGGTHVGIYDNPEGAGDDSQGDS